MDKIDIVTTATVRPEILERTYASFCRNLFGEQDRYRLIINIDWTLKSLTKLIIRLT